MIEAVDGSQGRPELARLQAGRALDCVGAAAGPATGDRRLLKHLPDESALFFLQLGDCLALPVNLVGQHPVLILKPRNSPLVALELVFHVLAVGSDLGRIPVGPFHQVAELLVQLSDVPKLEDAALLLVKI